MEDSQSFKLLDDTVNAVVVQFSQRSYPGVLIQGDTLKIILDDVIDLRAELENGSSDEAKEIAEAIHERISELLRHYEMVLGRNSIALPYSQPVEDVG